MLVTDKLENPWIRQKACHAYNVYSIFNTERPSSQRLCKLLKIIVAKALSDLLLSSLVPTLRLVPYLVEWSWLEIPRTTVSTRLSNHNIPLSKPQANKYPWL